MSKAYQVTFVVRQVNKILCFFIRLGAMPAKMHVLTVQGRKTGKLYHTPVSVVTHDGQRFLVAPYGEVNWVKNARVQGEVMLEHGRK
jgi:deazaflavin-dependent oxidoreductase (nitroreductase family)